MKAQTWTRCGWCGRRSNPVKGVYLTLLYPGQTMCSGCGRRSLFCTCR